MQNTNFTLDREFIKWFYEQDYPNMFSNRATVMKNNHNLSVEQRDYWMRQAFKAGAESMWAEIDHTLLQYACACEGLDPELLTPAQMFDRARENLWAYVHNQLELFNDL